MGAAGDEFMILRTYCVFDAAIMDDLETNCEKAFKFGDKTEALTLLKQLQNPSELKTEVGSHLLNWAADHGWLDVVELLISQYNCDVNRPSDRTHITPVYIACCRGHLEIVKYLCNDAKCDPTIEDIDGKTALDKAHDFKHDGIVRVLTNYLEKCKRN